MMQVFVEFVLLLCLQDDFAKRLDDILPRLASDDLQERLAATRDLKKLVDSDHTSARKHLKARIPKQEDPQIKASLLAALGDLPILVLTLEVDGEARVGKPVKYRLRIKNESDEPQMILAPKHLPYEERYPVYSSLYFLEVRDSKGNSAFEAKKKMDVPLPHAPPELNEEHFIALRPDEEVDPWQGDETWQGYYSRMWIPDKASKYKVTFGLSYERKDSDWPGGTNKKVADLLKRVPKVKVQTSIDLEVKP